MKGFSIPVGKVFGKEERLVLEIDPNRDNRLIIRRERGHPKYGWKAIDDMRIPLDKVGAIGELMLRIEKLMVLK